MEHLVRGKFVITLNPDDARGGVLRDGAVLVSGSEITAVGAFRKLAAAHPDATVVGSARHWVLPGFVNAHQHGKGLTQFQLGGRDDCFEIARFTTDPTAAVDPYLDALYACKKMIEAGITTCLHYNSSRSPETYEADAGERLRAYENAGLRVAFGLDIRDRNHMVYGDEEFLRILKPTLRRSAETRFSQSRTAAPDDYFRIVRELGARLQGAPRAKLFLCPAGPQWCTEELLRALRDTSREEGLGVQIHVLETQYQRSYFQRHYRKSAVQWLADLDFLAPSVSLAHGVWLDRKDIETVAQRKSAIVHNPSSNLRLRSGIAPISLFHAAGVRLAMGLDSSPLNDEPDMFQEMRLAANLQRTPGLSPGLVPLVEIFKAATVGGARTLGWDEATGTLMPGKRADIVLVDARAIVEPYLAPYQSPIDALVYRGKASAVDTVMVDGEILYRKGKHVRIDERNLLGELKRSVAVPKRRKPKKVDTELLDAVIGFYRAWDDDPKTPHHRMNSTDGHYPS